MKIAITAKTIYSNQEIYRNQTILIESGILTHLNLNEVCSNIAEGDERGSDRDSVRFFYIAKGSLAELITQLEIARDIEFISDQQLQPLEDECIQIGNMLGALIKARS